MFYRIIANSVNASKNRLDKYWANGELQYNCRATLNTRHCKTHKYLIL